MQIFVKALAGTRTVQVDGCEYVEQLKQKIEELEGIPASAQRLSFATSTLVDGRQLSEFELTENAVVRLALGVDGGRKKKKKKTYTKPKKIAHKPKKIKLAVLKYYKVDPRTQKIERLKRECPAPECGPGVFMANHYDRQYCGRCHLTYMFKNEQKE